ncbi:MAG: FHA domain-containing protein [Bdellovibrio sp.]|nr:FHA domain-containing protein [Bdellovibrio sp.]
MFKLTVISGPNRGTSYAVTEGDISVGRQTGNTIVLQSGKVSKRHCVFTTAGGEVTVKDLGSSNGTFVNGALTKLRKLKPGDRVSIGEFVIELVDATVKKPAAAPAVAGLGNSFQFQNAANPGQSGIASPGISLNTVTPSNQPPADLKGRALWFFENKFMPVFYGLNLKHEWKIICLTGFGIFVVGNLLVSVYPLLESSRQTVIQETQRRARFIAKEIADRNSSFLAAKMETKTDIGLAETDKDVKQAFLLDLDNRIIAPAAKMNQYFAAGSEAAVAVRAKNAFREGREIGFAQEADDSTVVAVEPVKVMNPALGRNVIVAMALVALDTSLATPDPGTLGIVYAETLIFTSLIAGFILLILYKLTLKPFQVLNEDLDKALKGDISQVTHDFKLEELNPLWEIINSAIQRIPKTGGASAGGGDSMQSLASSIDEFLGPMKTLGNISKNGVLVFDSEQKIVYLNSMMEEITGIRSDGALGHGISEVARDQSMAAFTADILGRTPVGGEGLSEDYDFSGISYKIHTVAFGVTGQSAKCLAMVAIKAEG